MDSIEGATDRTRRRRREWFTWGMLLLLVAGYYSLGIGAVAVMASDDCRTSTERPICSPVTQQIVGILPIAGLAAGFLVGLIGGVLAIRRATSPLGWLGAAWAMLVIADLVALSLATAKP